MKTSVEKITRESRCARINLTVLDDLHGEKFLKAIDITLAALSRHIKRNATPNWREIWRRTVEPEAEPGNVG